MASNREEDIRHGRHGGGIEKRVGQLTIPFLGGISEAEWRDFKRKYDLYRVCESEKAPIAMHLLVDKSVKDLVALVAPAADGDEAGEAFVLTTALLVSTMDDLFRPATKQASLEKCKTLKMRGVDLQAAIRYVADWNEFLQDEEGEDSDANYEQEVLVKQFAKGLEPVLLREMITNAKCGSLRAAKLLAITTVKDMYAHQQAVGRYFGQTSINAGGDTVNADTGLGKRKRDAVGERNSRQDPSHGSRPKLLCTICKKPGHAEDTCWHRPGASLSHQNARIAPGQASKTLASHGTSQTAARAPSAGATPFQGNIICHNCGKQGHVKKHCRAPVSAVSGLQTGAPKV